LEVLPEHPLEGDVVGTSDASGTTKESRGVRDFLYLTLQQKSIDTH
jgi:hypothetical protein